MLTDEELQVRGNTAIAVSSSLEYWDMLGKQSHFLNRIIPLKSIEVSFRTYMTHFLFAIIFFIL
jgi:hypothetical protein